MRGERSGGPWVDSAEGQAGLCRMRGPGKPPAEALFSPVRLRGSTWARVELEGGAVPGLGAGASDAPGDEEELERKTKEARRPGRGGARGRVQAQKSLRRRGVLIQLRVISGTSRPWIRLRKNLKSKSVMGQDRPKDNGLGDRQRKETRGNSKGRGQTHNRKYLFHSCLNSDSLNLR